MTNHPFFSRKGNNLRQRRGGKYSDRRYHSEGGDESAAESTDWSVPDLTKIPSVPEFFGYALCPGTVVFGPWVKYSDYFGIFVQPRWVRRNLSLKICTSRYTNCLLPPFLQNCAIQNFHQNQCYFLGVFWRFRRVTCQNFELDEDFCWVIPHFG